MVHYGPPGELDEAGKRDEAGKLQEDRPCTSKDHAAAAR
jgi:hypothetical protein